MSHAVEWLRGKIRVAASTLDTGPITCGLCESDFAVVEQGRLAG